MPEPTAQNKYILQYIYIQIHQYIDRLPADTRDVTQMTASMDVRKLRIREIQNVPATFQQLSSIITGIVRGNLIWTAYDGRKLHLFLTRDKPSGAIS